MISGKQSSGKYFIHTVENVGVDWGWKFTFSSCIFHSIKVAHNRNYVKFQKLLRRSHHCSVLILLPHQIVLEGTYFMGIIVDYFPFFVQGLQMILIDFWWKPSKKIFFFSSKVDSWLLVNYNRFSSVRDHSKITCCKFFNFWPPTIFLRQNRVS